MLLLADLRDEIGDEAFFTLLRTYAAEFADGNVTTAEFIALAEISQARTSKSSSAAVSSHRSDAKAQNYGFPASTQSAMS